MTQITICMGSSCFARGNEENLEYIKEFLEETGAAGSVSLKGCLCSCNCNSGPNISINNDVFGSINTSNLKFLLNEKVKV